jgi:hypothetical protein
MDVQNPLVQANFPLFVFIKDKIVNNRLHGDWGYQFTGYQSPDGQVPCRRKNLCRYRTLKIADDGSGAHLQN